jgi:hypothetical protein
VSIAFNSAIDSRFMPSSGITGRRLQSPFEVHPWL